MENASEHNDGMGRSDQDASCAAAGQEGPKHAKHAASLQVAPEPSLTVNFVPDQVFPDYAQAQEEPSSFPKTPFIVLGAIVAVLLMVYLAGVFVFTGRFYPNTNAASLDISFRTPAEVCTMMDDSLADYTVQVRGQNVRLDLTATDLALDMDSQAITRGMMANRNPWAWPFELTQQHDETDALVATYGSGELERIVSAEAERINATAIEPRNADIFYDDMRACFDVSKEEPGTKVDAEAIVQAVAEGVMSFARVVNLEDDVLVKPQILSDDPRVLAAQKQANAMVKIDIPLMVNGEESTVLKGVTLADWISVSPEGEVSINEENLTNSMNEFLKAHTTVGAQRSYIRADGKNVTVSGGSYGWSYDGAALTELVKTAFANGSSEPIEVPVLQKADMVGMVGGRDWGPRYCDIDLSEQHAYFYDESGACVWETDVVTGSPGSHATPAGVYRATAGKASPSLLIGQRDPSTGKPEYETEVAYWMPFIGNSIGLHDATWQSVFGGNRYAQGYGSHGCVNISLDAAASLYDIIKVGDVVVVHW